jgi:hypothetical protein
VQRTYDLIKEHNERVFFQLVKAMAKVLNLRMPPCYRANGGVAKNGVYELRQVELVVDCALPTDRETASRRPDVKLRLSMAELPSSADCTIKMVIT